MEQAELHPIACKSCRDKKSKCDRELPICSQCSGNNITCEYPTTNKRGIPSGYISLLERRLLETELVLFELLSTFYNHPTPIAPYNSTASQRESIAEYTMKQTKSERTEEWKAMGLATNEQRYNWWQNRCGVAGVEQRESSGSRSGSGIESVNESMATNGQQLSDLTGEMLQLDSPREDGHFSTEGRWQPVETGFAVPPLAPAEAPAGIGQWHKYF